MPSFNEAWWRLMATKVWGNTVSSNGLLPGGTTQLSEPMLTYHQWGFVAPAWWQIYGSCSRCLSIIWVWYLLFNITLVLPKGQWFKETDCVAERSWTSHNNELSQVCLRYFSVPSVAKYLAAITSTSHYTAIIWAPAIDKATTFDSREQPVESSTMSSHARAKLP